MRLLSLLIGLAILGYVIYIYQESGSPSGYEGQQENRPQQAIKQAEQAAKQFSRNLESQQQQLDQEHE